MVRYLICLAMCLGVPVQAASAQSPQPGAMALAQAHDRCMTTFAVRETKTDLPDNEIFAKASSGCEALNTRLNAAIRAEYPADKADELIAMLAAQAKPNFQAMLGKIRNDRQRRAGN